MVELQVCFFYPSQGAVPNDRPIPIVYDHYRSIIERRLREDDPVPLILSVMRTVKEVNVKLSDSKKVNLAEIVFEKTELRIGSLEPC